MPKILEDESYYKCLKCKQILHVTKFYKIKTRNAITARCKTCLKEDRKINYEERKRTGRWTPAMQRDRSLRERYGINLEIYNQMLARQNYQCAICKRKRSTLERDLHVDHNHKTGAVRGLLCAPCNRLVGIHEKYPDRFKTVTDYVVEYG